MTYNMIIIGVKVCHRLHTSFWIIWTSHIHLNIMLFLRFGLILDAQLLFPDWTPRSLMLVSRVKYLPNSYFSIRYLITGSKKRVPSKEIKQHKRISKQTSRLNKTYKNLIFYNSTNKKAKQMWKQALQYSFINGISLYEYSFRRNQLYN